MNKLYYYKMLENDRLIPLFLKNRICGLITYIICNNIDDIENKNPYEFTYDNSLGEKIYIEQLIVKTKLTMQDSIKIFNCLINIIKEKHPYIKTIFWKRYNHQNNRLNLKIYNIKREDSYVYN